MNRVFRSLPLLAALVLIHQPAEAQFEDMKHRTPSDANTLVLINAQKLYGSPLANRQDWVDKVRQAYESGVTGLPPDAAEVMLLSRTDFEFGQAVWEVGMVKSRGTANVEDVLKKFGGESDVIMGMPAARLPGDHYLVQLQDNLLASATPANRQDVRRWLSSTETKPNRLIPAYLNEGFKYADQVGTPIVMAIDLTGAISESFAKSRLQEMQLVKDAGASPEDLAKLISGVQGITLGITVGNRVNGAVRVDFSDSAEILKDIGKPLLIEILERQGDMIDDLHDWEPSVKGNSFQLRGNLSPGGMRRVLSVLELPPTLADAAKQQQTILGENSGSAELVASQQYYGEVTTLLEDLRKKPRRDGVKTFGQAANWWERYARKIDKLPILNVDEQLLQYGSDMANLLRDGSMRMKAVGMRSGSRTRGTTVSGGGGYAGGGWYGGGGWFSGYAQALGAGGGYRTQGAINQARAASNVNMRIRGQERIAGASNVQQIWRAIDESTAVVRKDMTQKYQVEF